MYLFCFSSDPHIKLVGYPEDVCLAKEKIMMVLDTKVSNVLYF